MGWGRGVGGGNNWGVIHLTDLFFMSDSEGKGNREKDEEDAAPLSSPSSCPGHISSQFSRKSRGHKVFVFGVQQNEHFSLKLFFFQISLILFAFNSERCIGKICIMTTVSSLEEKLSFQGWKSPLFSRVIFQDFSVLL